MNISDLPPELLTTCFAYLKGPDLARVSQTCSFFNDIASIEKTWQKRCRNEYGLPDDTRLKASFKEVYAKVLHKYGRIIGLWRNKTTSYGGLVHIWFTEEGDILAEEFYGQSNVNERLLRTPVFTVGLDHEKNVQIKWLANCTNHQPCVIHSDRGADELLTFNVEKEEEGTKSSEENEKEKRSFLEDCGLRGTHRQLCMYKWQSYKQNRDKQAFERLEPSRFEPVSKVPIQPGLFKGMYGGHGTEVVHLFYESDGSSGTVGIAQKISGDPNVPSGETSIKFFLNKHMLLDEEEQELWTLRFEEDDETKFPYDPEKPCRQLFIVPFDVLMDNRHTTCPEYCIGRFHGKGTVSPMGFRSPTVISVHFVVFNPDLFGVLWMDLHSFSLFSRADEKFPGLR